MKHSAVNNGIEKGAQNVAGWYMPTMGKPLYNILKAATLAIKMVS